MDKRSLQQLLVIVALPVTVAGGLFYLLGKHIESQPQSYASISVQGEAKVAAAPDLARVTLGVQTGRQTTSQQAMTVLQERMKAVLDSVRALGVDDKDLSTNAFSLNPEFDWITTGQVARGFQATQNIVIKVRDLAKVGDVLSAATAAGANQVSGVEFVIDDMTALRAQARQEAVSNAKNQAKDLAKSLDTRLGRLTGFSEDTSGYPMPMYDRAMGMGGGGAEAMPAMDVPGGEQEITVRVYLTYELK